MAYFISVILGYLLGCSSMAYYIGKIKKIKLKEIGSKNYGASNTAAMIGMKAGFLVLIHDIAKAYLAVLLARLLFPDYQYVGVIAGISAVLGHIFPFYLKFDGGKGFAAFMGALIGIDPIFALCLMAVALACSLLVDYVVVGTFMIIGASPLYFATIQHDWITCGIICIASLVILYKHKENIKNLVTQNGKEMRIRSALQKKYKHNNNNKKM